MKLKLTNIIKETLTKKEALEAINNDFLQFIRICISIWYYKKIGV